MKLNNLFKVLVIGGAALTAHAQEPDIRLLPNEEGVPTFCSPENEKTCEPALVNGEQTLVPLAGLKCCWGTSCDSSK